ncbi:MAG: EAL domain-containing protein [Pseudomonadales bacterium]
MNTLRVLLLDLAACATTENARDALGKAPFDLFTTADWRDASAHAATDRPDLAVITASTVNDDVLDICSAIRRSNRDGEVYTVLVTAPDVLRNTSLVNSSLVSCHSLPDDWHLLVPKIELMARSSRKVQNMERAWQQDELALDLLDAAGCSIDAGTQSCTLSMPLRRLLRLRKPSQEKQIHQPVHWRDMLTCVLPIHREQIERAVLNALATGEEIERRCALDDEKDASLICRGRVRRDANGDISTLDLTWQRINRRQPRAMSAPRQANGTPVGSDPLQAIEERINAQSNGSILFLSIANYRELCKTLGYVTGQRVLAALVEKVAGELRGSDIVMPRGFNDNRLVARIGGAEIIAVLDGVTDQRHLARIKQRLLQSLQQNIVIEGRTIPLKLVTGEAIWPRDGHNTDDLIVNAALAAEFTPRGTGLPVLSEQSDISMARNAIRLEADLYDAVLNQEFVLHYQPKYSLGNGQIVGVEALLRWHQGHADWIPPDVFIPIAERNGLIASIGAWVIKEAVQAHARWYAQGLGRIPVAINISAHQLAHKDTVTTLLETCQQHGVDTRHIELEVTESCLIEDAERAVATLQVLRAAGFTIALDDFGTGFSSLSYLRSLPLDVLKIDRSFVSMLDAETFDPGLLVCIIGIGLTLGLRIVAEGIENDMQFKLLEEWGCHEGQGYLMSRPLPEAGVIALIERDVSVKPKIA